MGITVEQILLKDIMKSSKILAGSRGLSKEIEKISFIDGPIDVKDKDTHILSRNSFYISSLYFTKNDTEYLKFLVKTLVETDSSGLGIFDHFIKEIPVEVEELANRNGFPIIMINSDIPYNEIIVALTEEVLAEQQHTVNNIIIDSILHSNNTYSERRMIGLINKSFKENIVSLYFSGYEKYSKSYYKLALRVGGKKEYTVFPYLKGFFIFMSFSDGEYIDNDINTTIEAAREFYSNIRLGISNMHSGYNMFKQCISEAMLAQDLSESLGREVSRYDELGVYKILLNMAMTDTAMGFMEEFFAPLKKHDEINSLDLVKAARIFVKNEGDYRKTADDMFLHENSVRYRIKLIQELTNLKGKKVSFYEQLSLAVRIMEITQ